MILLLLHSRFHLACPAKLISVPCSTFNCLRVCPGRHSGLNSCFVLLTRRVGQKRFDFGRQCQILNWLFFCNVRCRLIHWNLLSCWRSAAHRSANSRRPLCHPHHHDGLQYRVFDHSPVIDVLIRQLLGCVSVQDFGDHFFRDFRSCVSCECLRTTGNRRTHGRM